MTNHDFPSIPGHPHMFLSLGELLGRVEEPDPGWTDLPARPGVYLILWPLSLPLLFRAEAGTDGSVLAQRWREITRRTPTDILYIGMADSLKNRLRQLARFGRGRAATHQGGRALWWVAGIEQADVLVQGCPDGRQAGFENEALERFHKAHGHFPLANRQGPRGTARWWPED